MEGNVQIVKSFKKLKPIPEVPDVPEHITRFLPSPSSSLLLSSPNDQHRSSSATSLSPLLSSPFQELGSSSQPRLIQSPQSDAQKLVSKFGKMEEFLKDSGFDSLGEFLEILFYNPSRLSGEPDPRGSCHAKAVSRFLQGRNKIKMSDIIPLIYGHKHSAPSPASPRYSERHAGFIPSVSPEDIFHARPSLFSWATNLVATHVHQEIVQLSRTNGPDSDNHLQASTNGRRQNDVKMVTWDALGKFSISALCEKFKARAPVSWHMTESMAAYRKNGKFVTKKRRPHPIVSVICYIRCSMR